MSHKRSAPSPPPFGRGCPGRRSFSLGDPSGKAVRAAKKEGKTNPPLLHIMYAPPWRTHHIRRRVFPVPPGFRPASAPSSPKGDDEEKGLFKFCNGHFAAIIPQNPGEENSIFSYFSWNDGPAPARALWRRRTRIPFRPPLWYNWDKYNGSS